jgi:hypothetical protein
VAVRIAEEEQTLSERDTLLLYAYQGQSKNSGNLFIKNITVTPSFHVSFEVVPLGTVGNCAQGDYFEGDGGN